MKEPAEGNREPTELAPKTPISAASRDVGCWFRSCHSAQEAPERISAAILTIWVEILAKHKYTPYLPDAEISWLKIRNRDCTQWERHEELFERERGTDPDASFNAVPAMPEKHGLLSKDLVISGESPAQFRSLIQSFYDYFQPDNPLERMLVDRIIHCNWRLRRSARYEAAELRPANSHTTAPDLRAIGVPPNDLKHMLGEDRPKLSEGEVKERLDNFAELEQLLETQPYIPAEQLQIMFQVHGPEKNGFVERCIVICNKAQEAADSHGLLLQQSCSATAGRARTVDRTRTCKFTISSSAVTVVRMRKRT